MDALLEIAKIPSVTAQGFVNFDKRREIFVATQNFVNARLEESTVKVTFDRFHSLFMGPQLGVQCRSLKNPCNKLSA